MIKERTVCWVSAGVSSFVSGYLAKDYVDDYIYIDIEDQHRDSIRFIKDCEVLDAKGLAEFIIMTAYDKEYTIREVKEL